MRAPIAGEIMDHGNSIYIKLLNQISLTIYKSDVTVKCEKKIASALFIIIPKDPVEE
jgi:hypothetical protein